MISRAEILKELKEKAEPGYAKPPSQRTYRERADIWYYENFLNPDPLNWDEGESIDILDGVALSMGFIKNPYDDSDFPDWFREKGEWFGKKVKISNDDKEYTLIGMNYTYEDYYYKLKDSEGKITYHSCVGGIELV